MAKPRISGMRLCRTIGCEGFTESESDFCGACNHGRSQRPPPRVVRPGERDVDLVLLRERMAGGGPHLDRVEDHGTHPCPICEGPALPGRLYCSDVCRARARRGEGLRIVLDGIEAKPLEHAKRLGISEALFYKRIRSGASVEEALTRPLDEEMQRRARCR